MTDTGRSLEEEVVGLLQSQRYNAEILPRLEEFVNYQVAHEFSDSEANLAVLKLYQFYPDRYNASIVSKILIKALMSLPSTDFLCALYLIPERRQVDEPIPVISQLASLLETGRFKDFWAESGTCADLLASVPGSLNAIREFMLSVIARTYQTIDVDTLVHILNLDKDAVLDVVAARGWTVEADIVSCPDTEENQPRAPAVDEQLSFKQVAAKML